MDVEFTILMPEKTIAACISEVIRGAEKLQLDYEILISDNGSTDSSADIARQMGVKVITAPEKGYGSALISGINAAAGKYIIIGGAAVYHYIVYSLTCRRYPSRNKNYF